MAECPRCGEKFYYRISTCPFCRYQLPAAVFESTPQAKREEPPVQDHPAKPAPRPVRLAVRQTEIVVEGAIAPAYKAPLSYRQKAIRFVIGLCGAFLLTIFAAFVWPTLYRYDRMRVWPDEVNSPVRVNRFTGESEYLTPNGWYGGGKKHDSDAGALGILVLVFIGIGAIGFEQLERLHRNGE